MGNGLLNEDRPRLPKSNAPEVQFINQHNVGEPIENAAKPNLIHSLGFVVPVFLGIIGAFYLAQRSRGFMVGSLGNVSYGRLFAIWLSFCIAFIVADSFQMLRLWSKLSSLLFMIDTLPLRRSLYALKGFSWGNVWKMRGSVYEWRYKLISRQMEAFWHLKSGVCEKRSGEVDEQPDLHLRDNLVKQFKSLESSLQQLMGWFETAPTQPSVTNLASMGRLQDQLAITAALVYSQFLKPLWLREEQSLIRDASPAEATPGSSKGTDSANRGIPCIQQNAEEFISLVLLSFIQNVLARIRTIALGMFWLFMIVSLSVISYPFDPRPVLGGILLSVLAFAGVMIFVVYAGMDRNMTLSHITNTTPDKLGWAFWMRLVAIGIGPLLAALTAFFPDISGSITSWLQPSADAWK